MLIDLTEMPSGARYEDTYGAYLEIFKQIAESPAEEEITIINPPRCWAPLLSYLDCRCRGYQIYFPHDSEFDPYQAFFDRTSVEVLCGFRPELIDALWKVDREWNTTHVCQFPYEKEFIVTNNGSFDRQEIQEYEKQLDLYVPVKRKVCLVPCAADKPYPALLHQEVLKRMPDDYYLCVATGVLGLVPQDLWDIAPHYDSGCPNLYRVLTTVRDYFTRVRHNHVVVYCDFYSEAIDIGYRESLGRDITHINTDFPYTNYINLLDPILLDKLSRAFGR